MEARRCNGRNTPIAIFRIFMEKFVYMNTIMVICTEYSKIRVGGT